MKKSILPEKMKGVMAMLLAMFVFTSINAFLKTAEHRYAPTEIVFFRNLFSLITYGIMITLNKEWGQLKVKNKSEHFFRALLGVISLSCLFQSIIMLPLTDAITLSYASCFFVVLLAIPMLHEKLHALGWAAIIVGFAGVILVAEPTGDIIHMGAVYAIISAFLEAFLMVHSRRLALKNTNVTIVLYYGLFATLISGLTLPFVWKTPSAYDMIVMITLGIGGGIGQYLITVAYRHATAGLLSPMIYTSLVWSFFYGVILFGEIPSKTLYAGVGLIIAAGVVVIFTENRDKIKQTN